MFQYIALQIGFFNMIFFDSITFGGFKIKLTVWPLKVSGVLLKQHCFIALTTAQLVKDQENFEENQTEQNTTIVKLRNRYSRYAGDEFRMWNRIQNTWERNMFFPNRKYVHCTWPGYEKWSGQSVVAIYVWKCYFKLVCNVHTLL